jgi:hypothetical protein
MAKRSEPPGPKPSLPGLVKLQIIYTGPGTPTPIAANVMHGRWADNTNHSLTDLNTVLTALAGALGNNILPLLTTTWRRTSVVVQSLGGDGLEVFDSTAQSGTNATASFPPSVAITASWSSGATWRGGKPRTYLPGVPESAVVSPGAAQLTTNAITSYENAWSAFMNTMNGVLGGGIAFQLGFPSYYHNFQFRTPPLFFPFFGVKVHGRLDSQRRRTGKERYFPGG